MSRLITRRSALIGLAAGANGLLAGCDSLGREGPVRKLIFKGDDWNRRLQRLVTDRTALAREFAPEDRSPVFRANGTRNPDTPSYNAHAANDFADWRIRVDGLVATPLDIPVAQFRAMPARSQITRHDCVEGWSAIGKWTGPQLAMILKAAGLRDRANYIVFHCADRLRGTPYYESIDLVDAFHPQTILAWAMNDEPLTVPHGAPVRLRVERQLGYKHAKFVHRIEAVHSLTPIGRGQGGYWEDVADYDWYAGI
ncbi:molybdopterin-dependent oxidoreductase [Stakelama saccharophila]|uniref:Molybdopterin-dependent oxidoreductase n=1 Tax=Stakelama saccharophila TaxID=3075605 RepID=A0ABZ0BA87_9SPHN|nr:molybdopterin-dependent oxidoreductase [Stakelama sp. W311]WNO54177.1 molybdopterin-dependent oxidoreductase [Stakelama sp. W311]